MITLKRYLLTLVALLTMTTGAWAEDLSETIATATIDKLTYTGEHFTITGNDVSSEGLYIKGSSKTVTISSNNGEKITKVEAVIGLKTPKWDDVVVSTSGNVTGTYATGETLTISPVNATTVTLSSAQADKVILIKSWTIYYAGPEPGDITLNSDKTVATMAKMPAYDATVSYELVRDMTQGFSFKVGEAGTDGFTIRVKKDGEGYVPSEMTMGEMIALITATDVIDAQNPVVLKNTVDYTIQMFAVGTDGKPTGEAVAFNKLVPGTTYVAVATGKGAYDGTAVSNTFKMTEAYDLTLSPATDAHLQSVTVDGTAKTPTAEGVVKGIEPTKKVKITTTGPDYIIRKAAVTKTVNMLYIEASNHKLYYMEGETWRDAIRNHADLNQGWQYGGMEVWFGNIVNVLKGNGAAVDPGSQIDPTKTYTL